MRKSTLVAVGAVVLLFAGALLLSLQHPSTNTIQSQVSSTQSSTSLPQPMLPTTTITIGDTNLTVELATTPQEQDNGLSERTGLAPNTGMLFVFDPPQTPGFWMKEMLFSLDIIYAAQDGTIVTIYPNLSPSTYPQAFKPSAPAGYVLEVPAGFAAQHGVVVGQKIVVGK